LLIQASGMMAEEGVEYDLGVHHLLQLKEIVFIWKHESKSVTEVSRREVVEDGVSPVIEVGTHAGGLFGFQMIELALVEGELGVDEGVCSLFQLMVRVFEVLDESEGSL